MARTLRGSFGRWVKIGKLSAQSKSKSGIGDEWGGGALAGNPSSFERRMQWTAIQADFRHNVRVCGFCEVPIGRPGKGRPKR